MIKHLFIDLLIYFIVLFNACYFFMVLPDFCSPNPFNAVKNTFSLKDHAQDLVLAPKKTKAQSLK